MNNLDKLLKGTLVFEIKNGCYNILDENNKYVFMFLIWDEGYQQNDCL